MTVNDPNTLVGDDGLITQILSQRDAFDRANRIASETEARNVYAAAQASGDAILADAVQNAAEQNGWDLTITSGPAGAESLKARGLVIDLLNVLTAAPGQVQESEQYTDPRLNAKALGDERKTRTKTTFADLSTQAAGIVSQLATLEAKASARADRVIPSIDLNDAAQLTRTAQAWEYVILPQLKHDVKPDWATIIASLDADGLLALQRFAPSWIKADNSNNPTQGEAEIQAVMDGVRASIANALADPTERTIVTNADDCTTYLTIARQLAAGLSSAANSRDMILLTGQVQTAAFRIGANGELIYPTTTNRSPYAR